MPIASASPCWSSIRNRSPPHPCNEAKTLVNRIDNTSYIVDRRTREVRPTFEPTVVPAGSCLVGIRIQDLGENNTLGFEFFCKALG